MFEHVTILKLVSAIDIIQEMFHVLNKKTFLWETRFNLNFISLHEKIKKMQSVRQNFLTKNI